MLLYEARDGHSSEHSWGQSQVGVDDSSVLPIPMVCDGWVEARPEHPQKEGAYAGGRMHLKNSVDPGYLQNNYCEIKKYHVTKLCPPIIAKTSEW